VHPADVQDRDGAVLVIKAIHQLFPWLRHPCSPTASITAPICAMLLANWATGRSRSSNAPPMPPALKFCHVDGLSNGPLLGSTETAAWPRISRRRSPAPKRGFTCLGSAADQKVNLTHLPQSAEAEYDLSGSFRHLADKSSARRSRPRQSPPRARRRARAPPGSPGVAQPRRSRRRALR